MCRGIELDAKFMDVIVKRYIEYRSGRYDDVVYRFDTDTGSVDKVKVGREPHGLTVWPQPGRYSLGHTGNLR